MDPRKLKTRIVVELLALATLSVAFLALFPSRPIFVDILLAVVALILLSLNVNFTKNVVWEQFPIRAPKKDRLRASFIAVFGLTLPLTLICFGGGVIFGYSSDGWDGAWNRVAKWHVLISIGLFFPWALLQQTLFQYFLLGRLLSLLPYRLAVFSTAMLYGAVHLPDIWITLATAAAGIPWTYWYYQYRVLTPLAFSHAMLGSVFYYWVYGQDLLETWQGFLK